MKARGFVWLVCCHRVIISSLLWGEAHLSAPPTKPATPASTTALLLCVPPPTPVTHRGRSDPHDLHGPYAICRINIVFCSQTPALRMISGLGTGQYMSRTSPSIKDATLTKPSDACKPQVENNVTTCVHPFAP